MTEITPRDAISALAEAEACLREGGVLLVPTDTVYGLAVLPTMPQSVARLFAIKSRPGSVNLPIMVADAEQLEALGAHVSKTARQLLKSEFVPGALTLVFGINAEAAPDWLKQRKEIAVRIPNDKFLLQLIGRTGPILATSANRHGFDTPAQVDDILVQLELQPDLAIDGGSVDTVPSTLVNCNVEPVVIERIGVVSQTEIERVLNDR
ncbi:MAG: threonylcarbamoyl-AMP synthase [Rhizobiaceae bacterium]|nr:threonylcarbamoyl-AMP synthase [Rhizobiaceae bacterium]